MKKHNSIIIDSHVELHPSRRYSTPGRSTNHMRKYEGESFNILESELIQESGLIKLIKNINNNTIFQNARDVISANLPRFICLSLEGAHPFANSKGNDILYRLPIKYKTNLSQFKNDFILYLSNQIL
jgi:hypothetical protein